MKHLHSYLDLKILEMNIKLWDYHHMENPQKFQR